MFYPKAKVKAGGTKERTPHYRIEKRFLKLVSILVEDEIELQKLKNRNRLTYARLGSVGAACISALISMHRIVSLCAQIYLPFPTLGDILPNRRRSANN